MPPGAAATTRVFGRVASVVNRPVARGRPPMARVDLVVVEQFPPPGAVTDLEQNLGMRVAGPERGEEAGQDVLSRGGDGGQPHPAALSVDLVGGGHDALVEEPEHAAGVPGEDPSRLGDNQSPTLPPDQGHTELALQGGHRGRHRRLAHEQALGGLADRACRRHLDERAQLGERHELATSSRTSGRIISKSL